MNYNIQSDKSVKIYNKINVITNIEFDYDISLDLNEINIKDKQSYLFSTTFVDLSSANITSIIYELCSKESYLNIVILENKKDPVFKKLLTSIKKFHYVLGKKIILISDQNYFKNNKLKEFIFFIKRKNEKKQLLKKIKQKLTMI